MFCQENRESLELFSNGDDDERKFAGDPRSGGAEKSLSNTGTVLLFYLGSSSFLMATYFNVCSRDCAALAIYVFKLCAQ